MIAALLLSLALGQADAGALDGGSLDAGAPVEQLYTKCDVDAPKAEVLDGGLFEPWPRVKRENCKIAACEDFANSKLSEPASPGTVLGLVAGGVAVAALAFVIGFVVPHPK